MSEKAFRNKLSVQCLTAIDIILILAYLVEVLKGSKSILFFTLVIVFGLLPVALCWLTFLKSPEQELIKYILLIGYAVYYGIMLFGSDSALTFVYAIPMVVVIGIYNDLKYTTRFAVTFFVLNIGQVVYLLIKYPGDKVRIANSEIQIALMLLTGIFSVLISKMNEKFNNEKIERVEQKEEQTTELLKEVMSISSRMVERINQVTEQMDNLGESVRDTQISMEEVNQGNNDSANSIQNQMQKTEEIQKYIEKVTTSSEEITNSMRAAEEAIVLGSNNMKRLISQVQESEKSSGHAVEQLNELNEYTAQMTGIVDLIHNVASQTSLLALNASIEAARAGEAGRGFAVVATEISNLAGQTQSATENITSLITNIDERLKGVVSAINSLIAVNSDQNQSASETAESFGEIEDKASAAADIANELVKIVENLSNSNKEIVESIQTISAVTEEISAHSTQTLESSQHDSEIVMKVSDIVKDLNDDAVVLKSKA